MPPLKGGGIPEDEAEEVDAGESRLANVLLFEALITGMLSGVS